MPVRLWNGNAYPRPRLDRARGVAAGLDDPFAEPPPFIPQIAHRGFHILLDAVGNRQRTLAFGPFAGNGVLRALAGFPDSGGSFENYLGVRVSLDNSKDGVAEPAGTAIPGELITLTRETGIAPSIVADEGFPTRGANNFQNLYPDLRHAILLDRFFIKITWANVVGSTRFMGYFTLYYGIPAEFLGDFLR